MYTLLFGKTILILLWLTDRTDNTDFFAACFSHTEMTEFTDTVSIACSPRYLLVVSLLFVSGPYCIICAYVFHYEHVAGK